MQGTLTVIFTEWVRLRLIPVHTGNTQDLHDAVLTALPHPRAYGEYPPAAAAIRRARGSSPCIRGILPNLSGDIGTVRLIPVHTGNTLSLGHTHSFTSAHPRAYGEY